MEYDVDCDVCEMPAKRQQCLGDGRLHGHGMVHGIQGEESSNSLYALCDKHYKQHEERWQHRLPRIVEAPDGKSFDVYI